VSGIRLPARIAPLAQALGPAGCAATLVLAFWAAVAISAPLLASHPEGEIITDRSFAAIGEVGLLGSDHLGRDLFSRIVYGARTTLTLAAAATVIGFLLGVAFGFTAGILGGRVDAVLSRIDDAFVSIPQIMLALVVISAVGSSLPALILTVGFIEGTRVYRVARAVAQNVMTRDFVEVSRARGETLDWILVNDVLPNAVVPLSTDLGLRFTYAILLLSALSFLGLGVQPPGADWGMMVRENLSGLPLGAIAPLLPAVAIFSVTVAINLLVDLNLARSQRFISTELLR